MTNPEDVIVGKSVEEIESESGNRVNSPVDGEARRDATDTVLTPALNPAGAGVMGTGALGAAAIGTTGAGGAGAGAGAGALAGLTGVFGTEADRDALKDDQAGDRDNGSSEE